MSKVDPTRLSGGALRVEIYMGAVGQPHRVKLDEQILVTEGAPERLSSFPLKAILLD